MDTNTITRHVCPRNCYSSCSILGYTKNGRLQQVKGDPKHGYTRGKLCAKGYNYLNLVYHPERLKYPMIQSPRGSGHWRRITWDEAIDHIASKMIELFNRYGSHEALAMNKYSGNMGILHNAMEGFFNSLGKTSRAVGNPCWAPGMDAMYYDVGGHQTSDSKDMLHAETIILWGINPVWTSIHTMPYLYEAQRRGAEIITIDPVQTETAKKSDVYIQVKPESDGALALAIAKYLISHRMVDLDFIEKHTHGWEELKAHLEEQSYEEALEACGQSDKAIQYLAERLARNKPATIWMGFGLQRHRNGGQNIRAINALAAMTGNIGVKGGGVQFGQRSTWNFSDQILQYDNVDPSRGTGIRPLDMNNFAQELLAQCDPPVKLLWITCRNLISQSANMDELREAFDSLELIVTVDHFLTETAKASDLVLPATTQFEEWDVVPSYWHHWISMNEPAIQPYYECKSEIDMAKLLSQRLNQYEEGFSAFPTHLTEEQFIDQQFNEELYEALDINHWRELLAGPRRADVPSTAWEDLEFQTPSGKFEFLSSQAKEQGLFPIGIKGLELSYDDSYPYYVLLNHEPFRINSQFQNLSSFRKINQDPKVYLHPALAKEKGITDALPI